MRGSAPVEIHDSCALPISLCSLSGGVRRSHVVSRRDRPTEKPATLEALSLNTGSRYAFAPYPGPFDSSDTGAERRHRTDAEHERECQQLLVTWR